MPDYCEVPTFYNETYPRARKEHRCCECLGTIRVGEKYARCVGKLDGAMFCETQHKACRDFAAEVNQRYGGEDGCFIAFGDVNNEITNAPEWCNNPDERAALQSRWKLIAATGRGEVAA